MPVPDKISASSPLAKAIGLNVAILVSKELSVVSADGSFLGKFDVPLGSLSLNEGLKRRISELLSEGKRPREIAIELRCSERMVRRRKKAIREQEQLVSSLGAAE